MKNKKGLTLGLLIDIGEGPHRLSLSHYCAYGSVHGGSVRNHDHDISAERPRESKKVLGSTWLTQELWLSLHGPCALPAV